MGNVALLVALAAGVVVVWSAISFYNRMVARQNAVDNAFSAVDVQLKVRCDLVPRVVDTVRGHMEYERGVLEELTRLRSEASRAGLDAATRFQLDGQMSALLTRVVGVSERYPELEASQSVLLLQRTLNEVESQIAAARRSYNAAVTDYNTAIESFPANLVAVPLGFGRRDLFEASVGEREAVPVAVTGAR